MENQMALNGTPVFRDEQQELPAKGISGNAASGDYAGWFDEKVYMSGNSSASKPTLQLNETETTDRARLRFTNSRLELLGSFRWH